ncbi:MAG: hypothetical protein JKY11_06645 [Alphaproteobacteria bacterium]|nr:hypothetical protein [Alphaproteobacteria bacterium]
MDKLKVLLENAEEAPVLIHPNMAQRYKQQITHLIKVRPYVHMESV